MYRKSRLSMLLHVVTLIALLLSLVGVSAAGAAPAPGAAGKSPVAVDAAPAATSPAAASQLDASQLDAKRVVRVVIQLVDAPLASYRGGKAGLSATSPSAIGSARLDVSSPASTSYLSYLTGKQSVLRADLAKVVPNARVDYAYQVVFNGVAAQVPAGKIDAIRKIAAVKSVTIEREFKLDMDTSLPLIGAGSGTVGGNDWIDSGLWATVGGHSNAGAGLKIADIDTGITYSHPCFDPAGYTYPASFPKFGAGYDVFVNPKIIAARAYFRADDPPLYAPTPEDDIESGHGTHTAGTIACNYGTVSAYSGLEMSGVAPKAQLMVYRVFYTSITGSASAWTPELLAAIEDVVKDGADVVNNSWGGTAISKAGQDPEIEAYSAAVDAGVTVVFSAGNSGPGSATVGSPGLGDKFITVGASTTSRTFVTTLGATAVTPPAVTIPVTVTNIAGRSLIQIPITAATVDLEVEGYADPIACKPANGGLGPLPASLVAGKIVVVKRGVCALVDKAENAAAGGALGVIIRNVPGGASTLPFIVPVIPTAHVSLTDGQNIKAFLTAVKAAGATATFTINGPASVVYSDAPDTVASFSSQGPTPELDLKPDIVAPGVNILSGVSYGTGFDFYQGTSMAAPHVTGASALLKQLHPTWTPAQIKSALMSTSLEVSTLGKDPTVRGAGRLSLAHPNDPGLTFDKPSVSFGLTVVGNSYTKSVTASDVSGVGGAYTVTVVASAGGAATAPASITVPANGTASFDVVLPVTAAGAAYGAIYLTDGTTNHTLHIPYWARRVADLGPADVLLIDDDNSADGCGPDYTGFYTRTLTALGLTYKVWEVTPPSYAIDFNQLRRYSKVVYFTGDAATCSNLSGYGNSLRNYLSSGGKMLITGQDIGFLDQLLRDNYGVSLNPELFFGASFVQDSIFPDGAPVPAMKGDMYFSTYLAGQNYDISTAGDGAGNQASVDEISARRYSDVDALPILFAAPSKATLADGQVGARMSSEPTIERVKKTAEWTPLGYRTEWLSFGLEGVNNNTGFNTREQLLDRLLAWLDDEVTVQITSPASNAALPGGPVTVTVSAATSVVTTSTGFANKIEYYRWDFGDGTKIVTTAKPVAPHGYTMPGAYTVYVEVMDSFGHKAVTSQVLTIVPARPDLSTSSKTVNKPTASPEEKVTYTLTIKNTGTTAATNASISDPIPAGTSYVAGSATGGAVSDAATKSITWSGAVAVGAEHTISFKVMINEDTAVGTHIVNTAAFKDARFKVEAGATATTTVVPQPVITLNVMADTFLDQWRPTVNFGNDTRLVVRAADVQAPLLKFDVASLPAGATIKKADLKMYSYASSNVGPTKVGIFQVLRPWNALQATWMQASTSALSAANLWEKAGANGATDRSLTPATTQWLKPLLAFTGPSLDLMNPGQWFTFTIPSVVQNWVNGDSNNGVTMKYVGGDVMVAYSFASSQYPYTPLRPSLTIQYVNP